jgi:hypothetical protein
VLPVCHPTPPHPSATTTGPSLPDANGSFPNCFQYPNRVASVLDNYGRRRWRSPYWLVKVIALRIPGILEWIRGAWYASTNDFISQHWWLLSFSMKKSIAISKWCILTSTLRSFKFFFESSELSGVYLCSQLARLAEFQLVLLSHAHRLHTNERERRKLEKTGARS